MSSRGRGVDRNPRPRVSGNAPAPSAGNTRPELGLEANLGITPIDETDSRPVSTFEHVEHEDSELPTNVQDDVFMPQGNLGSTPARTSTAAWAAAHSVTITTPSTTRPVATQMAEAIGENAQLEAVEETSAPPQLTQEDALVFVNQTTDYLNTVVRRVQGERNALKEWRANVLRDMDSRMEESTA